MNPTSLSDVIGDMQTQAQAATDALNAGDTGALQTAYNALNADATAAQPLIAMSITTGGLSSANSALQDVQTQLTAIYAAAFPFGPATTGQINSAITAAQNISRDATQLSTLLVSSAQNDLNSGAVQSQLATEEQQAAAGAAAQAAAQAAEAAQAASPLPPVNVAPATPSNSTGTAVALVGGGLALGALAWWWFL